MLGAPQEVIDQLEPPEQQELEIYPENEAAIIWAMRVIDIGMLKWHETIILGPDITAIDADTRLAEQRHEKGDYDRMLTVIRSFVQTANERG